MVWWHGEEKLNLCKTSLWKPRKGQAEDMTKQGDWADLFLVDWKIQHRNSFFGMSMLTIDHSFTLVLLFHFYIHSLHTMGNLERPNNLQTSMALCFGGERHTSSGYKGMKGWIGSYSCIVVMPQLIGKIYIFSYTCYMYNIEAECFCNSVSLNSTDTDFGSNVQKIGFANAFGKRTSFSPQC